MKVNMSDTTIPSYAVVPISSDLTQDNQNMPYAIAEDAAVSTDVTTEIANCRKTVNTKFDYISTKDAECSNRSDEEVALLATDIELANFHEHAIDAFNSNEDYKFKVFSQMTEPNAQCHNLNDIVSNQNYRRESTSLLETRCDSTDRQGQSIPMNLEQKILQNGLQNAIAHISEGTNFTSDDMKVQYKIESAAAPSDVFDVNRSDAGSIVDGGNALYNTNCITSHIPDIISSSSETNLFENGMEALSFMNNATLRNEPLSPVSHNLCADAVTNAPSEAIELAIATEEELPSPWIDVMALATAPALRTQSSSELNAFPTAVHSLVDLVGPEPYPLEIEAQLLSMENLRNVNAVNIEHISASTEVVRYQKIDPHKADNAKNKNKNVLQKITADADICKCTDCKCDNLRNCQNCTNGTITESTKKDKTLKIVDDFVSSLQNGCSCNAESNSCDSCCVVICLKTLQQLQKVFSRNCCKNTSAMCCKEKLLPSLIKCQLARNQ